MELPNNIGKIVELKVDWEDELIDDVGVEIMSLVDSPAIGIGWKAFSEDDITEHAFVEPIIGEGHDQFINRCMPVVVGEGKDQDQAYAICESYWTNKFEGLDIMDLIHREDFGEILDPENTLYFDFTKQKFDTQQEVIEGVVGLAIAGLQDASSEGEVKYKYAGPVSTRPFCAALLTLNKVYTARELQIMGSTIGNGIDKGPEAVTRWHGGPHCRHYFEQVRVFRSASGKANVINEGRVNDTNSNSPMYEAGIEMADRPLDGFKNAQTKAIADRWYAIQQAKKRGFSEMHFAVQDEEYIVTGPAMRAGNLIPRKDEETGEIFHVYFSADTIKKIAEKFLEQNKQNQTDINHSMVPDTENTLIESWIVVDPELDKSKALGFNAAPGDWYVSYKINNKETWAKIKAGEINGFSVAGQFIENIKNGRS